MLIQQLLDEPNVPCEILSVLSDGRFDLVRHAVPSVAAFRGPFAQELCSQ